MPLGLARCRGDGPWAQQCENCVNKPYLNKTATSPRWVPRRRCNACLRGGRQRLHATRRCQRASMSRCGAPLAPSAFAPAALRCPMWCELTPVQVERPCAYLLLRGALPGRRPLPSDAWIRNLTAEIQRGPVLAAGGAELAASFADDSIFGYIFGAHLKPGWQNSNGTMRSPPCSACCCYTSC